MTKGSLTIENMNKFNEIMGISEEIDQIIKSLNDEMDCLEQSHFKMNKLNKLKNENEELERIVELCKKELTMLEVANGKRQMQSSINKIPVKELLLKEETNGKNISTACIKGNENDKKSEGVKQQKKESNKKREKQNAVQKGSSSKSIPAEDALPVDIGRLDLKVGRILEVQKHKDADTLYVEKVDIGTDQPLTVVSGLVKNVPIEEMENRKVVLLCNLKPAKMRGVTSEAMVMCACSPEKVEILTPSTMSKPGDRVNVPGYPPPPNGPEPVLNPKKKIFETLAPELITDSECFATFRGVRWEVPGGYVKSATLSGVNIK